MCGVGGMGEALLIRHLMEALHGPHGPEEEYLQESVLLLEQGDIGCLCIAQMGYLHI